MQQEPTVKKQRKRKRSTSSTKEAPAACSEIEELPDLHLQVLSPGNRTHSPEFHEFSSDECAVLRENLLRWYDANQRQLPWRFREDEHKVARLL
jgi:hypothetical protein